MKRLIVSLTPIAVTYSLGAFTSLDWLWFVSLTEGDRLIVSATTIFACVWVWCEAW